MLLMGCTALPEKPVQFEVIFCSQYDCYQVFQDAITQSNQGECALYAVNGPLLKQLAQKGYKLVVDRHVSKSLQGIAHQSNQGEKNLMHNKFCILDSQTVITGSYNPVQHRPTYDNIVIIHSPSIAKIYHEEFKELYSKNFGSGKKTKTGDVFFCPEDACQEQLLKSIDAATHSIYFMTFAFTANEVGNVLMKKHAAGIHVEGMMEPSQLGKYSEHSRLERENISVLIVNNSIVLHHKVFIIDDKTVITGSYNPTKNANENNDENMVIIKNASIALQFLEEFDRIKTRLQ